MSEVLLPIRPQTLAAGTCFVGPDAEQQRLNAYAEAMDAVLNGQAFYNFGASEPDPSMRTFPWLNTTTGLWYTYFSGGWFTPRPKIEQDPNYLILWDGDEGDIDTIMGGTAGVATPTSGPFWAKAAEFNGRSPMGPGAIPTSNPAKTLSVREDFGEGAHAQTSTELYPHRHDPSDTFNAFAGFVKPGQTSSFEITGGTEIERMGQTGLQGGNASGNAEPANIVHPVRGVFILRPTNRIWMSP